MRPTCPKCETPDSVWMRVIATYDMSVVESGGLKSTPARSMAEIRCTQGCLLIEDESRVRAIQQYVETYGTGARA